MATNTTNFSWQKPTVGGDDDVWGDYLNDNLDSQDSLVRRIINHFQSNTEPTEKQLGTIWLDTTDNPNELKIYDGTDWSIIGFLNTTTNEFTVSSVNAYIGDMKFSAQAANHGGWLLCNGQSLSTTTYSNLFDLIGYSFGGSGANFNAPDLRGRVGGAIGTGSGLTARSMGDEVGAETVTLTATDLPPHGHEFTLGNNSGGSSGNTGGLQVISGPSTDYSANSSDSSTTAGEQIGKNQASGSQTSPSIMQPTLFVGNYFIYSGA